MSKHDNYGRILLIDHIISGKIKVVDEYNDNIRPSEVLDMPTKQKYIQKRAPDINVVLVDDVTVWLDVRDDSDLPNYRELVARPPYKWMWLEQNTYEATQKISELTGRNSLPEDFKGLRRGYLIEDVSDPSERELELAKRNSLGYINEEETGLVIASTYYVDVRSGDVIPEMATMYCYDKNNGLYKRGITWSLEGKRVQKDPDYLDAASENFISLMVNTLNLMNSTSVGVRKVEPPQGLSKSHKKRTGHPPVSFKTLTVKTKAGEFPLSDTFEQPKRNPGERVEGTALHKVRGHFKHYSADKPRFGRPDGIGTFWVNSFERGDENAGVVVKDYLLKV